MSRAASTPWGDLDECQAIEDDLACLAAGALPAGERARALAHAGSCPRCAAELAALAATADALRRLPAERPGVWTMQPSPQERQKFFTKSS